MATGKYTRLDGKKPSNCLTTIVVLFVGVCMIGAWMMMSSSMEGESRSNNVPEKEKILIKGFKNRDQRTEVEKTSRRAETDDNDDGKIELEETGDIGADKKDNDERVEQEKEESVSVSNNSKEAPEEKKNELDESSVTKLDGTENEVGSGTQETGSEFKDEDQLDLEREKTLKSSEGSSSTEGESTAQEGESLTTGENAGEESVQGNTESRKTGATGLLSGDLIQDSSWSTQSAESEKEKQSLKSSKKYNWKLCKVTAGADYIPCLDDIQTIKKLPSTAHYQHRERHCPDEAPTCLVPLPEGYKLPVKWSRSREKIWFSNVPHTRLAEYKGHQNWVKVSGEYLTFPGGGTQFKNGALHYIDLIQQTVPEIAWGKRSHVILDVGCGVASFGGYLFDRGVLTMSFAPKDEHEAQVQFALERGVPAISAVMGTKRLPYPSMVFDVVHCARCRVPWHAEGGKLLLELNRVLRPGGYFVWSATPVYQNLTEDVAIWKAMSKLTKSMCWKLVKIGEDKLNQVAAAIYRKPTSNDCYENRPSNDPPICEESDDPNATWNVELQACMHKVPTEASVRGSQWPQNWPERVEQPPYWLKSSDVGVYGKPAPKDFISDFDRWQRIVTKSYMDGMGIDWSRVRNVMDMRALYGGFAAALKNLNVWVMNVVPIDSPDTLPIIYERGLFGIYHDWCESFSTYPRTYDLLHADHLFSAVKKRCSLVAVIAEVDRILRPGGKLLVRDKADTVSEVESMARSLHWEIKMTYSEGKEGLLCVHKTKWRPGVEEEIASAIA